MTSYILRDHIRHGGRKFIPEHITNIFLTQVTGCECHMVLP